MASDRLGAAMKSRSFKQPGDCAKQALGVELRGGPVAYDRTQSQDDDPVGHLQHMRQGVGFEDASPAGPTRPRAR